MGVTVVLKKQWHDNNVSLRKINRMKKCIIVGIYLSRNDREEVEGQSCTCLFGIYQSEGVVKIGDEHIKH